MTERKKRGDQSKKEPGEMIRLNRFISNSGVCSRREADELIKSGQISVNNKIVTEMGIRVGPGDVVHHKGRKLSTERKVYILLNKPKGYITTLDDPHADRIITDLISNACPERVYPVGRLDKNTTGLLLLTNDGELSDKLSHPRYNRKKIYHVFLDKPVTRTDLVSLTEGVDIGEEDKVFADAATYPDPEDKTQVGVEIHSGQNRVVRRLFEALGYKIKRLDRVYYAGLTKKNLPRGKWRFLSEREVTNLKRERIN